MIYAKYIDIYGSKYSTLYLNCHSFYSLRYGLLSPNDLVKAASRFPEIRYLALTDINNVSGAADFTLQCLTAGLVPIIGIDFQGPSGHLAIGLARNSAGLQQLNRCLMSAPTCIVDIRSQCRDSNDVFLIYPWQEAEHITLRDNEFLGVHPEQVRRLVSATDRHVAIVPVVLRSTQDIQIHRMLRAIDMGRLWRPVGQAATSSVFTLIAPDDIRMMYRKHPALVRNAQQLLESCVSAVPMGVDRNARHYTESQVEDVKLLRSISEAGRHRRYGDKHPASERLLAHELLLITQKGLASYFLVCWDIVSYAERHAIEHVGRGSGGNSIVAYCLRITNVDPIRLKLRFDRFLNVHRGEPPDFDLDFSWRHRDHVLDYIFNKYPPECVSLLATFQTFKGRSIVWEVGKVLGLSRAEIKCIIAEPNARPKHHPLADQVFNYGRAIIGLPNYLSIHCGGLVISQDSLTYLSPLQPMPKGFPIVHFDMRQAKRLGFHKYDILSQRALGYIKDVEMQVMEEGHPPIPELSAIEQDDLTMHMLRHGETVGSFYIESPAMRNLLQKVPCPSYETLIDVTSIIRPGVAKSGMMQAYIDQARGEHSGLHQNEALRTLLPPHGIMIYQEDVLKVAEHFAGFSAADGDLLRKFMTGKEKSSRVLGHLRNTFFGGALRKGYSNAQIKMVWSQVSSFQGYAFCKAHSASYAVESMRSLYLKAHHPHRFIESVINNGGGYYDLEVYLAEARRLGLKVEAPCLRWGSYLVRVVGNVLYLGLKHIKGFGKTLAEQLSRGPRDLRSVLRCISTAERLIKLLGAGAFRNLGDDADILQLWLREHGTSQVQLFQPQLQPWTYSREPQSDPHRALAELEIFGFPLADPFMLLGEDAGIVSSQMRMHTGEHVLIQGYLIHKKPVTTESGAHMNFASWLDRDREYFESVHWSGTLHHSPFRGRGVYTLSGRVECQDGVPILHVERMSGDELEKQLMGVGLRTGWALG